MKIQEQLRSLRKGAQLTQREVAEALSMPQGDVSRIEHCRHRLSVDTLEEMLSIYGYDLVIRPKFDRPSDAESSNTTNSATSRK